MVVALKAIAGFYQRKVRAVPDMVVANSDRV